VREAIRYPRPKTLRGSEFRGSPIVGAPSGAGPGLVGRQPAWFAARLGRGSGMAARPPLPDYDAVAHGILFEAQQTRNLADLAKQSLRVRSQVASPSRLPAPFPPARGAIPSS
jgi:hypothetical protein